MFWAVKQLAQGYSGSDRKGLRCMSTWPRSVCSARCCSHQGNCGHSVFSIVRGDPFMFWASCTWPWHPCLILLEASVSFQNTRRRRPSPVRSFSCQQLFFPCMELIAGIFQKRKPGESHFSLNVERKQRPQLRAKSEWPGAPQPPSHRVVYTAARLLLVTGMACLSLLQKTLPGRGLSTL